MKCSITNKEIYPTQVFKCFGDSVVSAEGLTSLPPDMRFSPFLEMIVKTKMKSAKSGLWLFVEQATYTWCYPPATGMPVDKYIFKIRPAFSPDAKFHVFKDGTYLWSVSYPNNTGYLFIDHRWVFGHFHLACAAKNLDLTNPPSLFGVWVLTESDTQAGLSNIGRNGPVQSVKEAVDEIKHAMQPGFRYHVMENGRCVKTIFGGPWWSLVVLKQRFQGGEKFSETATSTRANKEITMNEPLKKRCLGFCGQLIPFNRKRPGIRLCARCREIKAKRLLSMSVTEKNRDQVKMADQ